jgi:hypothetical protein
VIKGWVESQRHCYGEYRTHALLGKKYTCKVRAKASVKPFGFRGYDRAVIDKSNDYIKMVRNPGKTQQFSLILCKLTIYE